MNLPDIWKHVSQSENPTMILVSATRMTSSNERVILGAYLPCFSEAERDAKDKVSRYDEFWRAGINRDCLFQLGPVHEVYSADQAGEGTNVKIEGGVSIGMGQTNLQLDEQLERGTFMYKGDLFELAPNDWKYGALRGTVGPVEIFALNSWTQGYVRSL